MNVSLQSMWWAFRKDHTGHISTKWNGFFVRGRETREDWSSSFTFTLNREEQKGKSIRKTGKKGELHEPRKLGGISQCCITKLSYSRCCISGWIWRSICLKFHYWWRNPGKQRAESKTKERCQVQMFPYFHFFPIPRAGEGRNLVNLSLECSSAPAGMEI